MCVLELLLHNKSYSSKIAIEQRIKKIMSNRRGRGTNFRRPGRAGFSRGNDQYRTSYRGINTQSFGYKTWTFYDNDQWERFQLWLKKDKEEQEFGKIKMFMAAMEETLDKREERKNMNNEGNSKVKKKGKKRKVESVSSSSSSSSNVSSTEISPKEKKKKKKKIEDKGVRIDTELIERLAALEKKAEEMGSEIEMKDNKEDGGKKKEVTMKEIEKEFQGTEGTKRLKLWCKENGIKTSRKQEMIMAVYAAKNEM